MTKKRRKLFVLTAAFLLIASIGYQNRAVLARDLDKITHVEPCGKPIAYTVGDIDPKFNITPEEFSTDIQEASEIWSTTIGKKLFVYDPKATLTISLVYDERQSLANQVSQLDSQLKQQDTKLKQQNAALKPEIAAYQRRVADYKNRMVKLNGDIDHWNSQGGAPPDEYQRLKNEQDYLQKEANSLNALAQELNQGTDAYNSQVANLNQTVGTYNQTYDSYAQALSYKPEEGIYIANEDEQKIIIYFYNSKPEIVHTLAHEMGHARGLEHVSNTKAIMFSKTNNATAPSQDDITQLTEICRKRSVLEVAKNKLAIAREELRKRLNSFLNSLKPATTQG